MQKIDCGVWLKSKIGRQLVHWYPNPGNAGDHLIAVATDLFFRSNDIVYSVISDAVTFNSDGKVICYGGGGNFVPSYKAARKFIIQHHERAARLIILPHTIYGNEDVLGALTSNTTIICRDSVSFEHCQAAAPRAEVLLADDLALSLNVESFLSARKILCTLSDLRTYMPMRRSFRTLAEETRGCSELAVWRSDAESHPARIAAPKHDLSRMFALGAGCHRLNQFRISASFFLSAIDRFSQIFTDRLHVAIGAAILGKEVELYSNSNYKNRAVYELSLRSFPKVAFIEQPNRACTDQVEPSSDR